jgi:hypothetical protein
VLFLALVRCILEPFRLQHYSGIELTLTEIKPFQLGSLVCALALLVMILLFYVNRYKVVVAVAALAVLGLLILKWIYMVP